MILNFCCYLKGRWQEYPLDFSANLKLIKIAEYWHVGFVLPEKHCPEYRGEIWEQIVYIAYCEVKHNM